MPKVREFKCNKTSDLFCYVCGLYTPISERRPISNRYRVLYKEYFKIEISNQEKCFVPHVICYTCVRFLNKWAKGEGHFSFGRPMIWRDPVNHETNCYICKTNVYGFSRRNKQSISYATVDSVDLPVHHSSDLPVPVAPPAAQVPDEMEYIETEGSYSDDGDDPLYIPDSTQPHMLSQGDLNDLVRDLNLTKEMSELLASRLQQWSLLERGVAVTAFRIRSANLAACFESFEKICYCKDIANLFTAMNQHLEVDDWRLFIDGSKTSIKAVLLNNGNVKPSIPVAFVVGMKEEFDTMKKMLELIQYERFPFKIVADFKMIAILMGLQSGFTKYSCFLCLWDSRARAEHFKRANWPERTQFTPGEYNVKAMPLVRKENIILPPLHIKLGVMTQFVKAVGKTNTDAIDYLDEMFPQLSRLKVEEGIFVGPQIRKVLHSHEFRDLLTVEQETAWISFEAVVDGFLGNVRDPNYRQIVADMLENFGEIGTNLTLKMHFLKSHINFFPENLGVFSDEQGERFHQDLSDMEQRFNGRFIPNMLGEYCWGLLRDTRAVHKRRGPRKHF